MVSRIQTSIPGLDKLIQGGLPKSSITLVSGTPGTGKSILCAQILYKNALEGKKCLYLNLEQNDGRIQTQMQELGWGINKAEKLHVVSLDADNPNFMNQLTNELDKTKYDLIV